MKRLIPLLLTGLLLGCGGGGSKNDGPPPNDTMVPLMDMAPTQTYLGFSGGLYPSGNTVPPQHSDFGLAQALAIQPLDTAGNPSPSGKYVLLSIGMSNTTQEFCSKSSDLPCDAWTFMGQAATDAAVDKTHLAIVNGAYGGHTASSFDDPAKPDYDRIRDTKLVPQGMSEKQVQAVWIKQADAQPAISLPSAQADAYVLEQELGKIVRALRVRYPNLKQVFLSSRIYGGYATTQLNPEPYAYESGFAVKALIGAQIHQTQNGTVDAHTGDMNYHTVAAWVAWGPYLWANGTKPRSDGLVWERADLRNDDGTHPSQSGQQKVGTMLLNFFKTSPYTKCWFVVGGTCP